MIVYRATQQTSRNDLNPYPCIVAGQSKSEERIDFTVSVVSADPDLLNGLTRLIEAAGNPVQCFSSPSDFLNQIETAFSGCVIVDNQLPDLAGLKLQAALARQELPVPVIFVSAMDDILSSVQAMKAGAFDVLPKPVDRHAMLSSISLAAAHYARLRQEHEQRTAIRRKFATLTARETEVLRRVIAGRLNKEIAFELGVVEKTIKVHRGRASQKLGTRSVVAFVRLVSMAGVTPCSSPEPYSQQ